MSKPDRYLGLLAIAGLLLGTSLASSALDVAHAKSPVAKFDLGQKATAAEIAGWNIDVRPDGQGLPVGQGSVSQGNDVYDNDCAMCHGTFGESNSYIALSGGIGSLASGAPVSTVGSRLNYATTLYDYINRAMPYPHSKALTADQVYAVTAYVLNLNNIVPNDFVANQQTLPKVKMPNRNGFKPFPGMMSVHGTPDVHNTACMKNCVKDVKVTASLPKGFVKNMYGDIQDNFRGLATMNELAPPASDAPVAAKTGPQLIETYSCTACHAIDHKVVGPGFEEVAAKYKGDAGAIKHLTDKIRHGGAGVWGQIPMPPQAGPSDAEIATLVHWVLEQTPAKK